MDPLLIDIANPQAIREQMPEIQALYQSKQREVERLANEVEALRRLIESLVAIAGIPTEGFAPPIALSETVTLTQVPPDHLRPAADDDRPKGKVTARQNAVAALRRVGRPIGPAALFRFMKDQPDLDTPLNPNALGAALYAAAKAGEIVRTDEGYAMRPITDYSKLPIDTPFSVPAGEHAHPELLPDQEEEP